MSGKYDNLSDEELTFLEEDLVDQKRAISAQQREVAAEREYREAVKGLDASVVARIQAGGSSDSEGARS